jgi:outer membrane protein assembly factor BamB
MNSSLGIENSIARYENLIFFADNGGTIKCIDTDLKEVWTVNNLDDTDSSITVDVEDGIPFIYTGCEVDKQGKTGFSRILKINGKTGKIVWEKKYECASRFGASPSNGGVLATNAVGKNEIKDIVIFTLCRYGKFDGGAMIALDKKTGKEVWKLTMSTYAWPSPVDVYDKDGKAYIIQADHNGSLLLVEGRTGKLLKSMKIDSYIEASPAVFNDYMVFASRTGKIYGLKLK